MLLLGVLIIIFVIMAIAHAISSGTNNKNYDPNMKNPINRKIATFGDDIVQKGALGAFLLYDAASVIKKNIDEQQKEKLEKLEKEVNSTDMFAPYRSVK